MGVAADCEYTSNYGTAQNATQAIITNWNTASALYKVCRILSRSIPNVLTQAYRQPSKLVLVSLSWTSKSPSKPEHIHIFDAVLTLKPPGVRALLPPTHPGILLVQTISPSTIAFRSSLNGEERRVTMVAATASSG